MAIPDGKPATDFSAMNREWVRAVAKEAAEGGGGGGGSGIPAPENPSDGDVLTYSSADDEWVAAAPGGGGGGELPPYGVGNIGCYLTVMKGNGDAVIDPFTAEFIYDDVSGFYNHTLNSGFDISVLSDNVECRIIYDNVSELIAVVETAANEFTIEGTNCSIVITSENAVITSYIEGTHSVAVYLTDENTAILEWYNPDR